MVKSHIFVFVTRKETVQKCSRTLELGSDVKWTHQCSIYSVSGEHFESIRSSEEKKSTHLALKAKFSVWIARREHCFVNDMTLTGSSENVTPERTFVELPTLWNFLCVQIFRANHFGSCIFILVRLEEEMMKGISC